MLIYSGETKSLARGMFSLHCSKCFPRSSHLSFFLAWQSLSRDKTFQTDNDGNQVFKGHRWGCLLFGVPHVSVLGHYYILASGAQSSVDERSKGESFWRLRWNSSGLIWIKFLHSVLCVKTACEPMQAGGVIAGSICCAVGGCQDEHLCYKFSGGTQRGL